MLSTARWSRTSGKEVSQPIRVSISISRSEPTKACSSSAGERAIDPFGDTVGRNTDILTPVADANAARRPCHRNEACRNDTARLAGFGRGGKAARAG